MPDEVTQSGEQPDADEGITAPPELNDDEGTVDEPIEDVTDEGEEDEEEETDEGAEATEPGSEANYHGGAAG